MILQPEKHHTVDLKNATLLEREKIRSFNSDARNPWFYSTMGGCHPRMVIITRNNCTMGKFMTKTSSLLDTII